MQHGVVESFVELQARVGLSSVICRVGGRSRGPTRPHALRTSARGLACCTSSPMPAWQSFHQISEDVLVRVREREEEGGRAGGGGRRRGGEERRRSE